MMSVYLASGAAAVHVKSSSAHTHTHRQITDWSVVRWPAPSPLTQALMAPSTQRNTPRKLWVYPVPHTLALEGYTNSHTWTCTEGLLHAESDTQIHISHLTQTLQAKETVLTGHTVHC